MVGPCGPGHFQLCGAAGMGDHCRAHQLADLHGRQAYAARCTRDQQGLSRLQAGTMVQRNKAGAIGDLQGRGIFKAHAVRNAHRTAGVECAHLGQAALAAIYRHAVADFKT